MTLYAATTDFVPQILPQAAADSFTTGEKTAALQAASDEADAELNRRYTLPLTAWGDDLRRAVATIAGYELLSGRGFDSPNEGSNARQRALDARAWLKRIGDGTLDPPGLVDSTVTTHEGGAVVITDSKRGW